MQNKRNNLVVLFMAVVVCISLLSGCSAKELSTAEKFQSAKDSLVNYTVDITALWSTGAEYSATLFVADKDGKIINEGEDPEYYTEEDDITIEHYLAREFYVEIFQKLFGVDFEEKDGYYVCNEQGLASLSEVYWAKRVESFKIKIENNKFSYAEVLCDFSYAREQFIYRFYDYGKTKV